MLVTEFWCTNQEIFHIFCECYWEIPLISCFGLRMQSCAVRYSGSFSNHLLFNTQRRPSSVSFLSFTSSSSTFFYFFFKLKESIFKKVSISWRKHSKNLFVHRWALHWRPFYTFGIQIIVVNTQRNHITHFYNTESYIWKQSSENPKHFRVQMLLLFITASCPNVKLQPRLTAAVPGSERSGVWTELHCLPTIALSACLCACTPAASSAYMHSHLTFD